MEVARIINEKEWGGNFTEEHFIKYPKLTEDWTITEVLPIGLISPEWDGAEWVEGLSLEQVMDEKTKKAIEIDLYYTKKISDLMMKHNDKVLESFYSNTTYVIPQSALHAKQALKNECNAKIAELGITDFTYRQSVPKLATK